MRRDWDLVRAVLLATEDLGNPQSVLRPMDVAGFDAELVSEHIRLLGEAGLLEVRCSQAIAAPTSCVALRLTWAGHEFLDGIRDVSVWNKVKGTARSKGMDLTLDVIKAAVKALMESVLRG